MPVLDNPDYGHPDHYGKRSNLKVIEQDISNIVQSVKPVDPLVLIATDILAMPFGLMLKFGEQLEKAKETKIEGSASVANAHMMHAWASTIIDQWKKEQGAE